MTNVVSILKGNLVLQNIRGVTEGVNTLGAIAVPLREKLLFLKEFKNEIIHIVLPHLNFWPAIEKHYHVSISTG